MKACQICLSTFDDAVRFCPFHGSELKPLTVHQYLPGETICGYYLKSHIGRDGLGELFCATKGGNVYRFRLYSGALLCDSGRVSRLHTILEKSFQLNGGGIPIADFDWLEDGTVYSAHPYIPGRSFHDILELGLPLNENEIAELLYHLLRAVKDIHTQRVTNGNIALSNIILDNGGRIRLHDVGIWDVLRGEHFTDIRDDHPEIFDDIIDLMSPEIARGEEPTFQSDVYSCGAAACCLFRNTLDQGSADARMRRHVIGDIQGIQLSSPSLKISNDFADLLDASMVGSSGVRFQTTRAFITALLSIHSELDDNADSLSPELSEKILTGAEKPVMRSSADSAYASQIDNNAWDNIRKEEEAIENTRHGIDPERTVIEKASWDDLASLVGENLERSAVTDMLDRAVTTEMDPFEASPTQEIPVPSIKLTNSTESDSIDNILSRLSEPSDPSNPGDILDFGAPTATGNLLDTLCAELNRSASEEDKKEDSETQKPEQPDTETQKPEQPDTETQKPEQPDTKTQKPEQPDSDESKDKDSNKKDKSGKKKKSKSKTDMPKVSEPEQSEPEPEAEIEDSDSSKPHKRIGRKKQDSDELERGDVISVSNSLEMRRIKRRRRTDFTPQNEIVLADIEIQPMVEPSDKPEYAPIPWMTTTSGYKKHNNSATHKAVEAITEAITAEIKQPEDTGEADSTERGFFENSKDSEDPWFGDDSSKHKSNQNKKRILLTVIVIMLFIGIGVIMFAFFSGKSKKATNITPENVWASRIEQFHADVKEGSEESLHKAIESLRAMRTDGLDREQLKQCHGELKTAYTQKADALRQTLKKSEEIPDPLDIGTTITQLDVNYNNCIGSIDATASNAADLKQNCETEKTNALTQAQAAAYSNAQKLIPELQNQSDGWTKLAALYQTLSDLTKRHPEASITTNLYESNQEQTRYATRLKSIETEGVRLAALNMPAQVPAEPAPTAPAEQQPVEQPTPAQAEQSNNAESAAAQPAAAPSAQPVVPAAPSAQNPPKTTVAENTAPVLPQIPDEPEKTEDKQSDKAKQNVIFIDEVAPTKQAQKVDDDAGIKIPVKETPKVAEDDPGIKIPTRKADTTTDNPADSAADKAVANNTANANTRRSLESPDPAPTPKTAEPAKPAGTSVASAQSGNVPTAKLLADASLAMKNDLATAEALCAQATKQDPKNARAWQLYANISEKQGKLALAASYAEKSCSISKTAACYVYLGNVRNKAGMTDEAQDAFQKALEIDPNNAQARAKVKN